MTLVFSVKVCVALATILWICHFAAATRSIVRGNINICENVADHLFIQDIENCTKYFVCVNGLATSQKCRSGLYFDANQQACVATRQSCLQCPSGRMINLPLAKTCNKYISCYYGQVLLRKCENNQQFNVKTSKCDLAENVDCVENRCSIYATEKDLIYMPSVASCENYYMCVAGEAKLSTCAEGLYFDIKCNCCEKSENVQCLAKNFSTLMESNKQKRYNSNYSKLNHTPTLIEETDKIICPSKGYFLYQYIEDSQYFIACVGGKASLYACAKGFQFNDKLKRCVSKQEKEEYSEVKNTELDINNCPEFGAQLIPHDVEASKYILCVNGKASIFNCPAEHYFDVTDSICRANLDIKCPLNINITLPHAQRNLYYLCINGKAEVYSCVAGLYYDANLKSCTKNDLSVSSSGLDTATGRIICPKIGTFKLPHLDKTKFYMCIDGNSYIFNCAQNESFDVDINTCRQNYAMVIEENLTNNSHTQSSITLATTVIASNIECPKFGTYMFPHAQKTRYYVCVDGKAVGFTCKEGYIFDSKTNSCRRDVTLTESNENQTPIVLNEPVAHILCPSFGAMKFAHKQKNKFYLCINGMATVLACAEGSFFESETETCRRTFELKKEISETITETSTNDTTSMECPISGTFVYPHVEKNLYYVCLEGNSIVLTCPKGLIFASNKNTCLTPSIQNENVEDQPQEEVEKIYNEANDAVKVLIFAVAIFTSYSAAAGVYININLCQGVADNIFLPVLNNCSAYYVCLQERAVARACKPGFLFDAKSQSCTKPARARCLKNCSSSFSSFCYERTCTKYVLCYAGTPVIRECRDGLQYNAETDRCDFPQYVDCTDHMCSIFNDATNITYLKSKAACDKYYVCMDGLAFSRKCSSGLHFNPACNCCDFQSNVNCTIPALKRNITPLSKAPPKKADIKCPQEGIHFYPHANEDKYYFCIKGRGVVMDCTLGLVYDPQTETCREKKNILNS